MSVSVPASEDFWILTRFNRSGKLWRLAIGLVVYHQPRWKQMGLHRWGGIRVCPQIYFARTRTPPDPSGGVLSEGDTRDSKSNMPRNQPLPHPLTPPHRQARGVGGRGLGRSYFAPEPASRTRPRRTRPAIARHASSNYLPLDALSCHHARRRS